MPQAVIRLPQTAIEIHHVKAASNKENRKKRGQISAEGIIEVRSILGNETVYQTNKSHGDIQGR
jgi:hypothetical protein